MVLASINWGEFTAIATGVLAVAAIVTAYFAVRGFRTAAADLRTAQDQLAASYRPLLIDVTETTSQPSDLDPESVAALRWADEHQAHQDWRHVYVYQTPEHVYVAVPLRNVGAGLAVVNVKRISVEGPSLGGKTLDPEVHRERVPPDETTRILCRRAIVPHTDRGTLRLSVPYSDFAGGQITVAEVLLKREENEDHWRVRGIEYRDTNGDGRVQDA